MHWRTLVRIEHGESPVAIDKLYNLAAALDTRLSAILAEADPDLDDQ